MKKLFIILVLMISSESFTAEYRLVETISNGRVSIDFGNGVISEYVDARSCHGNPSYPPAPPVYQRPHCLLNSNSNGDLISVSNSSGHLSQLLNESSISLMQRAVETGFCQLDSSDYCSFEERLSKEYPNCSPTRDTIASISINGVLIASAMSYSICRQSDNSTKEYGSNFSQYLERSKYILRRLCLNKNF